MDKDFLLIRKMKHGDENAMETFVYQYYPQILQYCRYHISDLGYAEDLVQETFEHFFRSLAKYEHHGKAINYLYVIAGNLCRDFYRKKRDLTVMDSLESEEKQKDALLNSKQIVLYFNLYEIGGKVTGAVGILFFVYISLTILLCPVLYQVYRRAEVR